MITSGSPEICWVKNFRLSKSAFIDLAEQLKPYIAPNPKSPNYRALSTEKKLAITLYYLKDTGSLLMTANCFGIAVNTVSFIITQVCENIVYHLGPIYISLPKTETEMRQKVAEFESKFGMFMDVECVWPGSVHDSKVFANSSINRKLRNGSLPGTFQSVLHVYEKIRTYIIGDPAYPLTPFCIKEYQTCRNNEQRHKTLVDYDSVNKQVQLIKDNEETYINQPNPVYSNNTAEGEFTRTLLTSYISECLPN
ncbi:uncharacterized protein LOC101239653 [Hydra vulgaris]|uniref:uncharacterized protein LOC101239653 n=1 Tax=Hydra vulgaris TaxID=6087 RepID=UPI001F5F7BD7|nr:protein ALP1-like [Hydra vulgaris]